MSVFCWRGVRKQLVGMHLTRNSILPEFQTVGSYHRFPPSPSISRLCPIAQANGTLHVLPRLMTWMGAGSRLKIYIYTLIYKYIKNKLKETVTLGSLPCPVWTPAWPGSLVFFIFTLPRHYTNFMRYYRWRSLGLYIPLERLFSHLYESDY